MYGDELYSEEYAIDGIRHIISRVLPETKIQEFKENFNLSETISVYKDKNLEEEVTSGYVGTGMYLKNGEELYQISVIGDLDSNGQIKQVEITKLIRHVVGLKEYQLTGVYLKSADLNNDGKTNHIDITILIRYEVYGELDVEENKKVESPIIQIVSGTKGENNWYTDTVKVKIISGEKANSEIEKTTYKISGTSKIEETVIDSNEIITLDKGTYSISAYNYSFGGFKSLGTRETIKVDNTLPKDPTIEVVGEPQITNGWYTEDVTLKVIKPELAKDSAPINKITYKIDGATQLQETEIENEGTITITSEGTSTITVYNYNEAGTRSNGKELIIQKDSQNPSKAEVTYKDLTDESYTLVLDAEDATSGIASYEIYIDNNLKDTINTSEKHVEYSVKDQKSGKYNVHIIVKDVAGHTLTSVNLEITMARLNITKVERLEFIITGFKITNADQRLTQEGVEATVSDTSLTSDSKWIMVTSNEANLTGTVEGKIRLVCNDGSVLEDVNYFPENLIINTKYYTSGSGTTYSHETTTNFFGIDLKPEEYSDGNEVEKAINISTDGITQGNFSISNKKLTGIQTYVRITISSVQFEGRNLPFKIIQQ